MEAMKQLQELNSSDNCDFVQKAKVKWAIEGDENFKFFHGIINRKRANLSVKGVMSEGEWVDDPIWVKDEFRNHFADRFNDPGTRHGRINFIFPNRLTLEQVSNLEASVSDEEIRKAVWGCGEKKSPGPDGFTFEFFHKFWRVVGPDFCIAVKWFFEHGFFATGCNSSFVTLIPKTLDPKLVSYVFEVDFAKAYDSIRWDYLDDVLNAFGFGSRWRMTINLKKSHILGLGIRGSTVLEAAASLGYSVMKTPFNYLGIMLISAIHGSSTKDLFTAYPSTWNSIIKKFNYLKVQSVDVFSHCKIRIGNGLHTRFWKDLSIGDCTLSGLFPRLFALDTVKDISVAGGIEEQQLKHLVALLDSVILCNSNDRWVNDLNGDGVFRVKDLRNLLDEFFLPMADVPTRWVKNIPIKVNIFAWRLALDRLPTRANLVQRNVVSESQSRAGISVKKEASVNFLTDPSDERFTLRPADVLVFGWVGGKHVCVAITGVSPLVGLSSIAGSFCSKAGPFEDKGTGAASSTKMPRTDLINLSSRESSPIQDHPINTTLDSTLALSIPPSTLELINPTHGNIVSPLAPRAIAFSTSPNSPTEPYPYLASLDDLPPKSSNP
uniref:RNA-directed DNA polymerase, eukaryota n=1 Tax=Tanacetum cinerariifolium TaxID=118510 RepID=A0A6L2KZZ3_TANCI|nr:RNA-directed DNA polymerase, eukaryota [Tanacetum cinerariifolium]